MNYQTKIREQMSVNQFRSIVKNNFEDYWSQTDFEDVDGAMDKTLEWVNSRWGNDNEVMSFARYVMFSNAAKQEKEYFQG